MAQSPQHNEILKLQGEITSEISRDAPSIAQGIFGDNKNHPDMASVSNTQLDDLYRQKYLANDRQWLQGEARRDPQQFLDVAKRIGVTMPQVAPGQQSPVVHPDTFGKAVMSNAAAPPAAPAMPPVALPAPPTALPPAAPPPVILGPNGQPLPPMGPM